MVISVAVCIYNDFDFLAEGLERVYDLADEIVILDGPYDYCVPMLQYFGMHYEGVPDALKAIVDRPKVRYQYGTFSDERSKRIALYEMCRGEIVMLLDSDELVTQIRPDEIAAFRDSDKSVAGARFHNHVRSDVLSTEDTRKLIFFKRTEVSAEQHLNYTWLVGVPQDKPDRDLIFDRAHPLVDIAHLTLMRSPFYSTVKYCFYTRLYFHSRGLDEQINKLFGRTYAQLADAGFPMEAVRDIFRRSVTDSLNFPEREKLRAAPASVALPARYDEVADIQYLDAAMDVALIHCVKTHCYVKIPSHLKAGDPLAFSFTTANVASMEVEGVFHNGDRCERVTAEVRAAGAGEFHGALTLPFDGGGWFGALLVFRPRCHKSSALGHVTGFRFKKRLGFYGNCQTENVVDFLMTAPAFARDYEVERTPGRLAHMMSGDDVGAFQAGLHRLDYLIAQPISDAFRGKAFGTAAILAGLRDEARLFMMPNLFVTAYAPDSYCVTFRKRFMQRPMPIHDVNFIYSYLKHRRDRAATKRDYVAKLDAPDFYSDAALDRGLERNIAELAARETEARRTFPRENAKYYAYSAFVAAHRDKGLLHYSDAHPTEYVFQALAQDILQDLGVADEAKPAPLREKGAIPFYRAIGERFGFDAATTPIYVNDRKVEFDAYFETYCRVYDSYGADDLFGYVSRNVTKVVVTNHKTGTMMMQGVLRDYCARFRLKLLELNQHLSANHERIDASVDFQAYDFIFITHAQHFEKLIDAAPRLRYRAIHLIRHPLEIIMSGVRYHQVTDEVWCNRKVFVADPQHPAGYRRLSGYDVACQDARGDFSYREIMNRLSERAKIAFEIRQHATAFGTIPAINHFLHRFHDDGNVATVRLEDIAAPECVAFVFKFLALQEDFLDSYRQKVGEKGWLGKHVTNREGHATYGPAFDDDLLVLFRDQLGGKTIAEFGYAEGAPAPAYFREPEPLPAPPVEVAPAQPPAAAALPERGTAEEFFAAGETFMAAGQNGLARQAYEKALEEDEYKIGTLGRLGDICVRLGQHKDALGYYRRIEGLTEQPPAWVYVGLGIALEALGDRPAALASLERAIQLGVDSQAIRVRLARLSV